MRFAVPIAIRPLRRYPDLDARDAVVLVRAARHYATALWVADNDPEQAWLQLVSALEAVATRWKATTADPAELFTGNFPEPASLIRGAGGVELLAEVPAHFAELIGAGRRFEEFVDKFKPEAPYERPPTATNAVPRVDWTGLRPAMKSIYRHRSALLHSGTPFPAALCVPPLLVDGVPEEKPLGATSRSGTTTWTADDTPMHLHAFAYLARGAILNWFASKTTA